MIYLDNAATSFHKPPEVARAMLRAMASCANPGRGGYAAAMAAARQVYSCRVTAAKLFHCRPEQVVFTSGCTHGLNIAIRSLAEPRDPVVISGFEHNAVTRPLHAMGAKVLVAGRKLFDWEDTLTEFEKALRKKPRAAVFTHVSNVFGYILPVKELAALCRRYRVPFVIDAAQSAGTLELDFEALGADFAAMPGHKGLLGPQGTGLLLCREGGRPLLQGGTGTGSVLQTMPEELPERLEAGTLNVPGIAGLEAGMNWLLARDREALLRRERRQMERTARGLERFGMVCFTGPHQSAVLSVLPAMDSTEAAQRLGEMGIAVRAGLHCAPLAHESAGTLKTGTLRLSFGADARDAQSDALVQAAAKLPGPGA